MKWDLSKLYQGFNDPNLTRDISSCKEGFAALRAGIDIQKMNADALAQLLKEWQKLTDLQIKTSNFVYLTLAVDSNNEAAKAMMDRIIELNIESEQFRSALSRAFGNCSNLDELVKANPILCEHAFLLKQLRDDATHVIDPALEPTVLKMQMTGGGSWEQLRDQLDSNLIIPFEQNGAVEQLPLSAIRALAYSPSAETRKRAYEAELAAYPRMEIPMAACLNGIKGEALTLIELRHFDTVLDTALHVSRMQPEVLNALLTAMRESLPMFRRYFRLKAKLLGHEGPLPFYDLFAPVGDSSLSYTLDEARETLVRTMGQFSEKMSKFIDNAFASRWIDTEPRAGKQGGAFCAGIHPLRMSYIMSNFDGSYSAVSTLAHELGHAYHDSCLTDTSVLLSDYPMPLAETASIFNETLLMEKTLEQADRETKITLIEQQLSDAAQVIVDIMSRYLFETAVIEARKTHALSPKELCDIMKDAQLQTYGDGLDSEALHPYMWACKSHYYSTAIHFYNFPYAFGQLFALGLYQRYRQNPDAFLEEYDELLRRTETGDVTQVAASVGIDVSNPDFWRSSLKYLENKLEQLESL